MPRLCDDCKGDVLALREYYLFLRTDLWAEVAADCKKGYLCVGCVERRLGRPLTRKDLLVCRMNRAAYKPNKKSDRVKAIYRRR